MKIRNARKINFKIKLAFFRNFGQVVDSSDKSFYLHVSVNFCSISVHYYTWPTHNL